MNGSPHPNSLESILPNGQKKLIIDGDAGDQVTLDGLSLSDLGSLPANGSLELDPFGDDQDYYLFVDIGNNLELYVHEDLVTFS